MGKNIIGVVGHVRVVYDPFGVGVTVVGKDGLGSTIALSMDEATGWLEVLRDENNEAIIDRDYVRDGQNHHVYLAPHEETPHFRVLRVSNNTIPVFEGTAVLNHLHVEALARYLEDQLNDFD